MQTNLYLTNQNTSTGTVFLNVQSYNVQHQYRIILTYICTYIHICIYIKFYTKSSEIDWYLVFQHTVIFCSITCQTLLGSTVLDLKNFSHRQYNQDKT